MLLQLTAQSLPVSVCFNTSISSPSSFTTSWPSCFAASWLTELLHRFLASRELMIFESCSAITFLHHVGHVSPIFESCLAIAMSLGHTSPEVRSKGQSYTYIKARRLTMAGPVSGPHGAGPSTGGLALPT